MEKLCLEEKEYKKLYKLMPTEWEKPIKNWKEIIQRYQKCGGYEIPERELTPMNQIMSEEMFFTDEEDVVSCLKNARYCPPFIHRLEFVKIIYVRSGCVTVYVNQKKYIMKSGNFCIVPYGVEHTVFSCHDEDCVINIIIRKNAFIGVFSELLIEQNILSSFFWKLFHTKSCEQMLFFECDNDEKIDRYVDAMLLEDDKSKKISKFLMRNYAILILELVMAEHLNDLKHVELIDAEVYLLPAMIQYIKKNLAKISERDLARHFGMNEKEIRDYLICESGYSFHYLIKKMRLERAAYLLENTKMSVEKIMEECGYSSLTNFYCTFEKRFKKTPQEYRMNPDIIL